MEVLIKNIKEHFEIEVFYNRVIFTKMLYDNFNKKLLNYLLIV